MHKYLGDSVYIEKIDPGWFQLYLDNGTGRHNLIVLSPETLKAFLRVLEEEFSIKFERV